MNVGTGTRLGPYELLSLQGKGGMGEVYRARDTRLDRTVAIKVLPQHLSSNPQRRQRFEREARAVSALSHPHICVLYDVGQQDGIDYLVMEYIEGQSLADRLTKGPLPLDQALTYAVQIADALDKAHRAGIVHRDLKPANIMLTKSGAKLLDFGLAKLLRGDSETLFTAQSNLPTERISLTEEGTIVGTFEYMAPEQLEAGTVDARTDIFSFGAVLYEMITGRKAFVGKSQASLIAAILSSEPQPVSILQPMSPPALDRVVQRCLAKEPDGRWQTARDLMLELKWVADEGSTASPAALVVRGKNRERLAWVVAGALLLALIVALAYAIANLRRSDVDVTVTRFIIPASEKQTLLNPTISPDGRRLVFAKRAGGKLQLWYRPLDSLTAQPLTEKISFPVFSFWSPDSRYIGFFSDGKLKKMDISGGPAQPIADTTSPRGASWNRDGVIIFTPDVTTPLYRVSATGGEVSQLTTLDESRHEISHRWPFFLPDGRHFLYLARSAQPENTAIYIGSLDSKETKLIFTVDSSPTYAPPGYLLFCREANLLALPFDTDRLEVTGKAFPVIEGVSYDDQNSQAHFSVSSTGVLVYRSGGSQDSQLTWFDRNGTQLGTAGQPGRYGDPRLSPDEKRVAVPHSEPPTFVPDIWIIELTRGAATRLTSDPAVDIAPEWSPDGSRIAFSSNRDGQFNLYQKLSSGAGRDEDLLKSAELKVMEDWSVDGRFILYRTRGDTNFEIWVLPLFGDQKPYALLQTGFSENFAKLSPNGKWVAYVSNETGANQVYVREFQGRGGKCLVSTGGGGAPHWRHDGKEIFYTDAGKIMAVDMKAGDAGFEPGVPKLLFERRGAARFDVSRDGQRFLVALPIEENPPEPIKVVMNWTADLKR
jgi:Tol biopolymer transport system component/predicted Ser/Thr protein kinase